MCSVCVLMALPLCSMSWSGLILASLVILTCNLAGLEVIKLEYSLKLKIKCNDWLLVDTLLN